MMTEFIPLAICLVAVTSIGLVVFQSWRWKLIVLGFQYLGVFVLVTRTWPFSLALVKLIAGLMACVVLALTIGIMKKARKEKRSVSISMRVFRLVSSLLILIVVFVASQPLGKTFSAVPVEMIIGGGLLIGNGLLILGIYSAPAENILGILTLLSGFEVVYAAVEISTLVAGLLAIIELGIALMGAYLIMVKKVDGE